MAEPWGSDFPLPSLSAPQGFQDLYEASEGGRFNAGLTAPDVCVVEAEKMSRNCLWSSLPVDYWPRVCE